MKFTLILLLCLLTAGCTTPSVDLLPRADEVRVRMSSDIHLNECEWKGEAIGSEGHWYNFLFYNNDTLMEGALNDLKNNAHELGGNTVFLHAPHYFRTSVTIMGTTYYCKQ
ncbi:DUF4156 domain-containing protein [Vibrio sp. HN007]|uniref:DUF4156 domain-containing protein n=1 Tax=Vibrio iocasae TaxID=3098914 RepID=UPI0035D4896F